MREGEERPNEDVTDLSCQYLVLGSERVQGGAMLEGAEPGMPVGSIWHHSGICLESSDTLLT